MTEDDRSIFDETLVRACSDMFAAKRPSAASEGPANEANADTMVASIGLAGPDFRGALVAMARPKFFAVTYPQELLRAKGSISDAALVDWAGEIANQLLGRMKNQLGRLGLDFNISTPTVVRGDKLKLNAPGGSSVRHALTVGDERVDVVFDIAHDHGKALLPGTGPVVVASLEGEGLLF